MEGEPFFVLLAGGKSERMGLPKGLLLYQETYWILEQLNRISESKVSTVFIGLGFYFEKYFEAIPWLKYAQDDFMAYKNLKIRVILNSKPEKGSFSTLQSVLFHITKTQSVFIQPIDVPILKPTELHKIMEVQNDIVQPNFKGKNGHPILVSPSFWEPLLEFDVDDNNARLDFQIKKSNLQKRTWVVVNDSCIIQNLNIPKDWLDFIKDSK